MLTNLSYTEWVSLARTIAVLGSKNDSAFVAGCEIPTSPKELFLWAHHYSTDETAKNIFSTLDFSTSTDIDPYGMAVIRKEALSQLGHTVTLSDAYWSNPSSLISQHALPR